MTGGGGAGSGEFPPLDPRGQKGAGGRTGQGKGPDGGRQPMSWSNIASMNTSPRDDKNVLEVRLEKVVKDGEDRPNNRFSLSVTEINNLLSKLTIDGSHLAGVSACPAGKMGCMSP